MDNQSLQTINEFVDTEMYDDLMSRYERVLVYAGKLQEKVRHQNLLSENNGQLENENQRLKKVAALDKSYIHLLERALEALGVMESDLGINSRPFLTD